jgi:hypothetical protein
MSLALDTSHRMRAQTPPPTPKPTSTPTPTPTPTQAANPAKPPVDPVEPARQAVVKRLDQNGWFNDTTHDELREINSEVHKLAPSDRNALVSKLSDDELKTWAGEVGSHGVLGTGGLERDERKALFDDLAKGLDGQQLARVSKAFNGEVEAKELGDAIAAQSTPQARREFVQAMAGRVESDPQAAVQVAKAIGGLKGHGAEVDAALGALSDSQLSAVIKAAKQEWSHTSVAPMGGGSLTVTYDVAPLTSMLDAVATGRNADAKAKVFEYAAKELKAISETNSGLGIAVIKKGAEEAITQSLSGLVTSDTNGVMRSLESNFREGRGITTFSEQMIRQGRNGELKVIIEQLRLGNDGKGDPVKRFEATEGAGNERNAQTLGYFVGSIYSGVSAINRNIDKQAGMVKAIFGASLSGGKDVAGMWLSSGAKGAVGVLVATAGAVGIVATDQIARDMKAGNKDLREGLSELAFPRDAQGRKYEGEEAETAYDAAVSRVITANSP